MRVTAWLLLLALYLKPPLLHSLRAGLPVAADDDARSAVVAVWGKQGTPAASIRCSGVFVAPEVVLTAAACVLSGDPSSILEQAACARGAADCPTLPPDTLEVLKAADSLEDWEPTAEVLGYEFRYSVPRVMAQVCTGGALCGDGWDIAALRVRQLCPRQRCIPPLPLSLGTLQAGETLRLVGVGADVGAGSFALRYHDGALASVSANQSLRLTATQGALTAGEGGPAGCEGDAGAPVLRFEASLENTTAHGARAGMYGHASATIATVVDDPDGGGGGDTQRRRLSSGE
jgi:hypothetical protein